MLRAADPDALARLDLLGLLEAGEPNADALATYEVFVYSAEDDARRIHREALMRQPVTQALIQGLHGRGVIAFDGALHFLAATVSLAWTSRSRSAPSC